MTPKKIFLLVTVISIAMLFIVPVVQAGPVLQQGDDTQTEPGNPPDEGNDSLGDTLEPGVKFNLGTVMAGKTAPGDDPADDDDTADNGDTTGDDGSDLPDGAANMRHPVAAALSTFFDVPYDEIMDIHQAGEGFGNIARAYFFAPVIGTTPAELLIEAHSGGWGNVLKQNGVHPGAVGNANKGKKNKPGDDEVTGPADTVEAQSGHGNGNGNGASADAPGHNKPDKDDKGNNGHGNGQDKNDKSEGKGKK